MSSASATSRTRIERKKKGGWEKKEEKKKRIHSHRTIGIASLPHVSMGYTVKVEIFAVGSASANFKTSRDFSCMFQTG